MSNRQSSPLADRLRVVAKHLARPGASTEEVAMSVAIADAISQCQELDHLRTTAHAYIAYEVQIVEDCYREWDGTQWVWNSDMWRKAEPEQFALVQAVLNASPATTPPRHDSVPAAAHQRALDRIAELMKADPADDSRDGIDLSILVGIVEEYEKLRYPMERPS